MATPATSTQSVVNRVIAQGEDFVIFFRLYPTVSTDRLDSVWFETDEGIETYPIIEPPYYQTCQLIYSSDVTKEFSTGDHHVRLWGTLSGVKYVLTELVVSVNPSFPFTKNSTDIDYTYTSNVSNTNFTTENGASIIVDTYTGRLANPAQWCHNTYEVETEDELPTDAQVGDMGIVGEGPFTYFICVKANPALWQPLAVNTEEYILVSDQVYIDCQPFEITE